MAFTGFRVFCILESKATILDKPCSPCHWRHAISHGPNASIIYDDYATIVAASLRAVFSGKISVDKTTTTKTIFIVFYAWWCQRSEERPTSLPTCGPGRRLLDRSPHFCRQTLATRLCTQYCNSIAYGSFRLNLDAGRGLASGTTNLRSRQFSVGYDGTNASIPKWDKGLMSTLEPVHTFTCLLWWLPIDFQHSFVTQIDDKILKQTVDFCHCCVEVLYLGSRRSHALTLLSGTRDNHLFVQPFHTRSESLNPKPFLYHVASTNWFTLESSSTFLPLRIALVEVDVCRHRKVQSDFNLFRADVECWTIPYTPIHDGKYPSTPLVTRFQECESEKNFTWDSRSHKTSHGHETSHSHGLMNGQHITTAKAT